MRRMLIVLLCVLLVLPLSAKESAFAQDTPPPVGAVIGTSTLSEPGVFGAGTCDSGRNQAEFSAEGLRHRVTGRCREDSTIAGISSTGRGVTVGDGEVELEVRVSAGHERARLFVHVRVQEDGGRYYVAYDPARGRADLRKQSGAEASTSLAQRDNVPPADPNVWTRVAIRMQGSGLWVLLDGQPVLAARDEEHGTGGIGVSLTRLGSPEDDAEAVAVWRELRVSRVATDVDARAPRFTPPSQQPEPNSQSAATIPPSPSPSSVVAEDALLAPDVFWPRTCATGRNDGRYDGDGLHLRVTGPCLAASTNAAIEALQPDLTFGDGEVRARFRVDHGHQRARVGIQVVQGPDRILFGVIDIGADSASIIRFMSAGSEPVGARSRGVASHIGEDGWISIALRQRGNDAWLLVGDEPLVHHAGPSPLDGTVVVFANRGGPVEDADELAVTLRDFTATAIEGGDPDRPISRAERPVVDPRYERILEFINAELVHAPGTDQSAHELRALGTAMESMLAETRVNLLVEPLTGAAAQYEARRRVIVVDEQLMSFTPHVATMLLLHELAHARQDYAGHPVACFDREVDAFQIEARLWRAWFGPNGKPQPGDDVEALFNSIVRADSAGRLREAVELNYRQHCEGR